MYKTETFRIESSSLDAAIAMVYHKLLVMGIGENPYQVVLRSVEFITNRYQRDSFTYVFDCFKIG